MPTWPLEVIPPINHPALQIFVQQIKQDGVIQQVKSRANPLPHGNCYWNVDRMVNQRGGRMVCGWQIMLWPQFYLVATHHAVWQNKQHQLIDVTQVMPPAPSTKSIVFLPDDSVPVTLEIAPCVDSHFMPLTDRAEVGKYLTLMRHRETLRRNIANVRWEAGYRCEDCFALASRKSKYVPNLRLASSQISYLFMTLNNAWQRSDDACYDSLVDLISIFTNTFV